MQPDRFSTWCFLHHVDFLSKTICGAMISVISLGPSKVVRANPVTGFPLPELLARLIDSGVWPSNQGPTMTAQHLNPRFSSEQVRRFAEDETLICLQPPPFPTVAMERAAGGAADFWERFGALDQITPEKALIIGDFGLGSDSPIILDYSRNPIAPPVLRLRWGEGSVTRWVEGAESFDVFARMLGLAEITA